MTSISNVGLMVVSPTSTIDDFENKYKHLLGILNSRVSIMQNEVWLNGLTLDVMNIEFKDNKLYVLLKGDFYVQDYLDGYPWLDK